MQGKMDSALCSKHNQPILNVYLTEKGIVGQCQQCVIDQQKPLEKFMDDCHQLTENAKSKLQAALQEREQRCNFLTKIIKAFQEELSKYLEEIIKTIDSQLEKSKTEVHDKITSFHDKKKTSMICLKYSRNCKMKKSIQIIGMVFTSNYVKLQDKYNPGLNYQIINGGSYTKNKRYGSRAQIKIQSFHKHELSDFKTGLTQPKKLSLLFLRTQKTKSEKTRTKKKS